MSRQLPEKPSLEYLKKEAKELRRGMPQAKLADAQHALANDYGFASWAKLKAHVEALALTPTLALTAAIRDSDAARVRELLERHADLRARIDAPLENYGHGQHAMFAAVQRGDRATIDVLLAAGADIRKRTEWPAGGFGVLDDCDPTLVEFLTERGAVLANTCILPRVWECSISCAKWLPPTRTRSAHAARMAGRHCILRLPLKWRNSCWPTVRTSTRAIAITTPRLRNTCSASSTGATIRTIGNPWPATWCPADARPTS